MNRYEFIDILRKTLEVELPADKVTEHIKYYDEYISSMGDSQKQEEEIKRIGDPRLIAKTIIDSFQDSSEYRYTGQAHNNYYGNESSNDWNCNYNQDYNEQMEEREEKSIWSKVKGIAIFTLVIFIIIMLLRFAFSLFIRIGIPVLVCYFIYKFVKERIE